MFFVSFFFFFIFNRNLEELFHYVDGGRWADWASKSLLWQGAPCNILLTNILAHSVQCIKHMEWNLAVCSLMSSSGTAEGGLTAVSKQVRRCSCFVLSHLMYANVVLSTINECLWGILTWCSSECWWTFTGLYLQVLIHHVSWTLYA